MCIPKKQEKLHVCCVYYVLGMHIVYESSGIMSYCILSVVYEKFVCIVVLKVCLSFGELVSCIHDANTPIFIKSFDYNGSVIFEIVQCYLFL